MKNDSPRFANPAEWTWYSAERVALSAEAQGMSFAQMLSSRLQIVYPVSRSDDEPEALRRLMAELAARDI